MTERLKVTGSLGFGTMEISDKLIDRLIEDGELPYDFEFRSLAIEYDSRSEVVAADVLSKIGYSEPSGKTYLTGPLPDCVLIPSGDEQVQILENLSEDYYRFADLQRVGAKLGAAKRTTYNVWASYIKELNPALYGKLQLTEPQETKGDPVKKFIYGIGRVVLRDEPLHERYESNERLLGATVIERRLLHYMLLDNHLELGLLD